MKIGFATSKNNHTDTRRDLALAISDINTLSVVGDLIVYYLHGAFRLMDICRRGNICKANKVRHFNSTSCILWFSYVSESRCWTRVIMYNATIYIYIYIYIYIHIYIYIRKNISRYAKRNTRRVQYFSQLLKASAKASAV